MTDHVIFSKPAIVTEEHLREAVAKQAKQRALKEALDKQILEADTDKRNRALRLRKTGDGAVRPQGSQAKDSAPSQSGARGPSGQDGPSPSGTSTAPAQAAETARYTFTFADDKASFTQVNSGENATASPVGRDGMADNAGLKAKPPSRQRPSRAPSSTSQESKPPVSPRRSSTPRKESPPVVAPTGRQPRRAPSSKPKSAHDAKLAALAEPKRRRVLSKDRRPTPTYQTNSLPVDFSDAAAKGGPGKVAKATPAKKRVASRTRVAGDSPTHDTQSLPVDLVYKLSNATGGSAQHTPPLVCPPVKGRTPSAKPLEPPHGGYRRPSSPEIEGLTLASPHGHAGGADYNAMCLPRNFALGDDFARRLAAEKSKAAVGAAGSPPAPLRAVPGSSRTPSRGVLTPTGGQGRGRGGRRMSPRTPGRPAGGVLPPISGHHANDDEDVIEMSAVLGNGSSETAPAVAEAAPGRSAEPAPRLAEKERGWESQVQRLKAELRDARRRERELAKNRPADPNAPPARAGTAPDPPAHSPLQDAGGRRPGRRAVAAGDDGQVRTGTKPRATVSQESREKPDFTKARVFTAEEFRPVRGPRFPTHSYVPSQDAAPDDEEGMESGVGLHGEPRQPFSMTANSSNAGTTVNSLKLASLTTRQTAFGLPSDGPSEPVPITFEHLLQFAEEQIITEHQAVDLWKLFCQLKGVPLSAEDASYTHKGKSGSQDLATSSESLPTDADNDAESQRTSADSLATSTTVDSSVRNDREDYGRSPSAVTAVLAPALRKKIDRMQGLSAPENEGDGSRVGTTPTREGGSRVGNEVHTPTPTREAPLAGSPKAAPGGARKSASRSATSHSSDGDDAVELPTPAGHSESTSKESARLSPRVRQGRLGNETFDTSVELYAPAEAR